jgi:nitroreductase
LEFKEVIEGRRSIRKFKDMPVEHEKILKILLDALHAPSACNKVLSQFVVVDDSTTKKQILKVAGNKEKLKTAPAFIVVLADTRFELNYFANILSTGAAIQNLLLSAFEQGIGSLWIGAAGDREKIKSILNIPDYFHIVAIIALGYPDMDPLIPRRPKLKEVVHFNRYEENIYFPFHSNPKKWTIEQYRDYQSYTVYSTSPLNNIDPPALKEEFNTEINKVCEFVNHGDKILFLFPWKN